jgi:hypothetical protein
MYKNLDSPHPLTPSPIFGIRGTRIISISPLSHLWEKGELELSLPSPIFGRGAGGEGKDLILYSDAP